jgi:hypothetical protein
MNEPTATQTNWLVQSTAFKLAAGAEPAVVGRLKNLAEISVPDTVIQSGRRRPVASAALPTMVHAVGL